MNLSTMRNLFKCGYSLCSKDLFVHPSTSRILYNYTTERNYRPLRSNQRVTYLFSTLESQQWSVNNNLFKCDHQYFSTSIPHKSQTALKPKSSDHDNDIKKQTTETDKPINVDKVENQPKNDIETGNVTTDSNKSTVAASQTEMKLTLYGKFKKMYKEYWYVLLPVHVVTSCIWLGGFYYLSSSGVDIPSLLESLHFSDKVVSNLRDSSLGHIAIAYLLYKIATPVRYTVTLGGTTLAIKYLSQWGYIRPVPNREQLKRIYVDQKNKFQKKE